MARALAIVSSRVAPTAVPSTMTGPLKPKDLSRLKNAAKSTLPVPNWIMTSGLPAPVTIDAERRIAGRALHEVRGVAVLGDHAGHVRTDELQLLHGILAGVVDDVAGIEEHAEVRMVDLLGPGDQIHGGVLEAVVVLDDHLDAALLAERRGVRQDLAPVHPPLVVLDAEVQRVLLAERVRVGDHAARVGDRVGDRESLLGRRESRDVRLQAAGGELLLQLGGRLRCRGGATARTRARQPRRASRPGAAPRPPPAAPPIMSAYSNPAALTASRM